MILSSVDVVWYHCNMRRVGGLDLGWGAAFRV